MLASLQIGHVDMNTPDPAWRFNAELSRNSQRGIVATLIAVCRAEALESRKKFKLIPIWHALGQNRYYALQEAFLAAKDDPHCPYSVHLQRHPKGTTTYVSLETAGLRLTLCKVTSRRDTPPLSLFRNVEQWRQLSFLENEREQLIAVLAYGFDKGTIDIPDFIEIRFPDGNGGYLPESIDLVAVLREPVPVEQPAVAEPTILRERKIRRPENKA